MDENYLGNFKWWDALVAIMRETQHSMYHGKESRACDMKNFKIIRYCFKGKCKGVTHT